MVLILLFLIDYPAGAELLVDDFDIRIDKNLLGGSTGKEVFQPASLSLSITNEPSGSASLKFIYDNMSGLGRLWEYYTIPGTNGMDLSSYNTLGLKYRGRTGGEHFSIGMKDALGNISSKTIAVPTVDTAWHDLSIAFSNFSGIDASAVKRILIMNYTNYYSSGTFFIDDISVSNSTKGVVLKIDDFQGCNKNINKLGYEHNARKSGTSTVSWDIIPDPASSQGGGMLRISYQNLNLYPAWWAWWSALASTDLSAYADLSEYDHISFQVKGEQGGERFMIKIVTLEEDESSVYSASYLPQGVTTRWQEVTIPIYDFKAPQGIGSKLNFLKNLTFLYDDTYPGEGTFYIDRIKFLKADSGFEGQFSADSPIKWFNLSNITFSPNNDGKADSVIFEYILRSPATVYLAVYDLSGTIVKIISRKAVNQQNEVIHQKEWTGLNSSSKLVKNGLYLFQLIAEDTNGKKEKIMNLLEVLR